MQSDNLAVLENMLETQLNDPEAIILQGNTTFAYPFTLSEEEAMSLSLPLDAVSAVISLDIILEGIEIAGMDSSGAEIARIPYPESAKSSFIRRIFQLYGEKAKNLEATGAETLDEEPLSMFFQKESRKTVRRFYLNYPADNGKGSPLHLYIETETDEEDASYLNYWIGCEEHTSKRYIASCQADLDQENPLEIVKVKHIYAYLSEITGQDKALNIPGLPPQQ